jgi:ABC-type glycerol-3-phosphate transport system permease component
MRRTKSDVLFDTVNYSLLFLLVFLIAVPLLNIIASSLSSVEAVMTGKVFLMPVDFSVVSYDSVFKNSQVWMGYWNSIVITVAGTIINLVLTLSAAYSLSRKDFFGRSVVMGLFTFTMLFSGGLIPSYLLVRNLKMLNTWWALIIPGAISVYNLIVAKTFFQTTIPIELHEASVLDGCNDFKFLLRIVLPLSGPIIAVLTLWYAVEHWNSYFSALLYIRNEKLFPLQIILRNILISNQVTDLSSIALEDYVERQGLAQLLKYSLIVVASVPMFLLYPFIQKYFIQGVMVGSIKG